MSDFESSWRKATTPYLLHDPIVRAAHDMRRRGAPDGAALTELIRAFVDERNRLIKLLESKPMPFVVKR